MGLPANLLAIFILGNRLCEKNTRFYAAANYAGVERKPATMYTIWIRLYETGKLKGTGPLL